MDDIVSNFAYGLNYLREQVAELSAEDMVSQPTGIANHPAWVTGHIAFSCQAIGGEISLEPWLPEDWGKRFGMGSVPVAEVSAYESKTELLTILDDSHSRIANAVLSLTPEQLAQPLPDANYVKDLPTIRHAVSQILVAHTAYHIGQVMIWRKLMGLKAMSRPFL